MLTAIVDTHTVIWNLYGDRRLSHKAKGFLDDAVKAGNQVGVATISLAEVVYLAEKNRIPQETFRRLLALIDALDSPLREIPFDRSIAETLARVERTAVPELPDRIIAATALHFGIPVISRDRKIQLSTVPTIW